MKLLRQSTDLPETLRSGAVAIGNFDGVHLGHARIVERVIEQARALGGPALVFTFDPHPVRLLRPAEAPPPLTWTDRKAELLAALGIDAVIAYPTDEELLQPHARRILRADRPRAARRAGHGRRAEFLFRPRPQRHHRRAAAA